MDKRRLTRKSIALELEFEGSGRNRGYLPTYSAALLLTFRFSLLLLAPDEIYFEDFSCTLHLPSNEDVPGRLKLCSKSLIFEPQNSSISIYKILLKHCTSIEDSNSQIAVVCQQHSTIFDGNRIGPYNFHYKTIKFVFGLNYAPIENCLQLILQLQRASSLPHHDEKAMISAISHSKQSRLKFDLNWLEDINESIVMQTEVNQISPLIMNPGRVVLSTSRLYFQPFNNAENYPVLKINLRTIFQLKLRRFLQRQVGLELSCENSSVPHLYLAFKSAKERSNFHCLLLQQPNLNLPQIPPEIMTLKWQNRAISNFEYLEYLNTLADRSFNDLTQYPVFPWVIADYTSPQLDLNDHSVYRDLSKPIGALNPERLNRLKNRQQHIAGEKFLYGSHYSTPAFVLFYLVRKCPQLMLCLQNGHFDHPDRLFNCVATVWRNVLENISDFKELIPEFYDPSNGGDFLENQLGLELGTRHDGHSVHDVILPPWCDSPQQFISILRDALESTYVSQNLPAWIDLIFGINQRGDNAWQSNNVFHPMCYEGAVDLDEIQDFNERHALEVQIMEFGQIPKTIFQVPHPQRGIMVPPPSHFSDFDIGRLLKSRSRVVVEHREAVTWLTCNGDTVHSVSRDSVLKELNCSSLREERSFHIDAIGISAVSLLPGFKVAVLGTFDNRIIVFDMECGTLMDEVRAHEDAITALHWNDAAQLLLSASSDGSLLLWPTARSGDSLARLIKTRITRFDHDSQITAACFSRTGQLAACGTDEGELLVYNIAQATCLFHWCRNGETITAITVTSDSSKIISGTKIGYQIFELTSGMLVYEGSQDIHTTCFSWLTAAFLLIGDVTGSLHCLDFEKVQLIGTLKSEIRLPITSLVVSQSMSVCSAQGNQVVLFDGL